MKIIPQVLRDRMNSDNIETFLLFRIGPTLQPAGQYLAYTTLPYDYTNPADGITYSSQNRMTSVDPPRVSDSLDRAAFKVALTDSDGLLRPNLDLWKLHGVPFVLYAGVINNTQSTIAGIPPGSPFDEKLIGYQGTVDTFTYTITPDEEILLVFEGTSPVGALDLTRTILTSKSYINQEYPNETCYDEVLEGSRKIILLWGKTL